MKKFWKILIVILTFNFICSVSYSVTPSEREKILSQIRKDYDATNSNVKNYKVKTVTLTAKHDPINLNIGDTVTFYNKNGIPQKMTVYNNIDNKKYVIEFYVKNKRVYFAIETLLEIDGKKVPNTETYKYYFSPEGKIVREIINGVINDNVEYEEGAPDITEIFIEMNSKLNNGY